MPTDLNPIPTKNSPEMPGQHTPRQDPDLTENSQPPTGGRAPKDGGAFRILTLSGIPVRIHWTLFLFLAYVAWGGPGLGLEAGHTSLRSLLTVVALFACVILHEMGHALTARRYGVQTRDIVLYPIGGVARLEALPRPRQELWIALAGPMVNIAIAAGIFLWLRVSENSIDILTVPRPAQSMLAHLLWANIFLGLFNLIPAFPMDGGRVLRALLAHRMDDLSATALAARIGQGMAILFGIYSLLSGNFILLFIALFVYQGAGQEAALFQTQELVTGHTVREAMLREFQTISVGCTLREAADRLLAGSQQDFPVVHGNGVVGLLTRASLMQGLAKEGPEAYVAGSMLRQFARVHPDEPLDGILPFVSQAGSMLVLQSENAEVQDLVGIVTQENLYEFLMVSRLWSRG